VSTYSSLSAHGTFYIHTVLLKPLLIDICRAEPLEESKPVYLQSIPEIPRKRKPALTPPPEETLVPNGDTITGKRKREGEGEDGDMTNGHIAKKTAGDLTSNGGDADLIVLDDNDGAILIDD
jgi:ubiquitin-like 1-activating enzyme E1 B